MPTLREFILAIKNARLTDYDAWRGRLVIWIAAATAGLIVVLFAKLADFSNQLFFSIQKDTWWMPIILTPLAGGLIVWLTRNYFQGAGGSGIPQTIAAINTSHTMLSRLVSLKIAIGKILLGTGALAAGFSSGREGPSVQVGASVMHAFSKFLPQGFSIHAKHLVLAGGAAGISAAFNTPLAGIVFAIEELNRKFEHRTNGIVITAIVLSGLVSVSIQGNYIYFGNLTVGIIDKRIILPVLVCSSVCGILGGIFSRTLIESTNRIPGRIGNFKYMHPIYWASLCGLMVALLGLISHGSAHGSGYISTQEMLNGNFDETWYYAPVKYLATIFTYLSGVPGGIFAPSLSIGAGIGHDLIPILGTPYTFAIYALCMCAFLAAVTQAPLTSFIIVMEMIDGHEMIISLMAVAMIASIISRLFSKPLYATMADNLNASR